MHFKLMRKRVLALGIAASLLVSGLTVSVGAAEQEAESVTTEIASEEAEMEENTETEAETTLTAKEDDTEMDAAKTDIEEQTLEEIVVQEEEMEEDSEKSEEEVSEEEQKSEKKISPTIEIVEKVFEKGTAAMKIVGLGDLEDDVKVKAAVWSQADQSDLYWYLAEYEEDGWYVDMDISKYHKNNWNTYYIHVYTEDENGSRQFITGTGIDFSFKPVALNIDWDTENQKATITITKEELKTPGTVKKIQCAVWSEINGQDDLKWYDMHYNIFTSKWSVEVPLTQLKSTGKCIVHAYLTKEDGARAYAGGNTYTLKNPSVESVNVETVNSNGDFTITFKGVKTPLGSKQIKAAVWSQGNQSDLIWYDAKQDADGNYTISSNISKHQYNIGKYYIHCYITDGLGISTCVKCTTMEFTKQIGTLSAKAADQEEINYTITLPVSGYPADLEKVEFAVWSNHNGQDDLKWYPAEVSLVDDGYEYQCSVDINNHKTSGTYSVHAYGTDKAGKKVFLAGHGYLFQVNGKASGTLQLSEKNEKAGTFAVQLSNISATSGVSAVKVAVWTQSNQSDLHWYTGTKQSDGGWTVSVNAANHNYHSGNYIMHAYVTLNNGIQTFAAGTSCTFDASECVENYLWPCPSSSRITSYFGYRAQPTAGASTYHQGIDIGASSGSTIVATKSGVVTACSYNSIRGYYVEITHRDGVKSVYMHMSRQAVTKGQTVSRGQTIGYVGSTGVATGPHLHFSIVVNGTNVNPLNYVSP